MKGTIKEEKKTDTASSYGPTSQAIRVNSTKIIFMVLENTAGRTVESMMANGHKIKCKVPVCLLGPMDVDMKVSTSMIRKKVVAVLSGQTVVAMMGTGALVIRKVSVFTTTQKERYAMAAGKMEKERSGYQNKSSIKKQKGMRMSTRDEQ